MKYADIKRLVMLVENSRIDGLEITDDSFRIKISKAPQSAIIQQAHSMPLPVQPREQNYPSGQDAVNAAASMKNEDKDSMLVEILSPMVGTFYSASGPEAEPYVQIGDYIQPGNILCIIEAMKLMNEIEAEISGKIIKILVENAQAVEYNQPLFLIEKA